MELDKEQMELLKKAKERGNQSASEMTLREFLALSLYKSAIQIRPLNTELAFRFADEFLIHSIKSQNE